MSSAALVTLTAALFEDGDFLGLLVFENFQCYRCSVDIRSANAGIGSGADHEDLADLDVRTFIGSVDAIEEENVLFRNGKLAALGLDRGFHGKTVDKRVGLEDRQAFLTVYLDVFSF